MELLIILIVPFTVITIIAVHAYATPEVKAYSFIALTLMIAMVVITSSLHFAVLTVSRQIEAAGFTLTRPDLCLLASLAYPNLKDTRVGWGTYCRASQWKPQTL